MGRSNFIKTWVYLLVAWVALVFLLSPALYARDACESLFLSDFKGRKLSTVPKDHGEGFLSLLRRKLDLTTNEVIIKNFKQIPYEVPLLNLSTFIFSPTQLNTSLNQMLAQIGIVGIISGMTKLQREYVKSEQIPAGEAGFEIIWKNFDYLAPHSQFVLTAKKATTIFEPQEFESLPKDSRPLNKIFGPDVLGLGRVVIKKIGKSTVDLPVETDVGREIFTPANPIFSTFKNFIEVGRYLNIANDPIVSDAHMLRTFQATLQDIKSEREAAETLVIAAVHTPSLLNFWKKFGFLEKPELAHIPLVDGGFTTVLTVSALELQKRFARMNERHFNALFNRVIEHRKDFLLKEAKTPNVVEAHLDRNFLAHIDGPDYRLEIKTRKGDDSKIDSNKRDSFAIITNKTTGTITEIPVLVTWRILKETFHEARVLEIQIKSQDSTNGSLSSQFEFSFTDYFLLLSGDIQLHKIVSDELLKSDLETDSAFFHQIELKLADETIPAGPTYLKHSESGSEILNYSFNGKVFVANQPFDFLFLDESMWGFKSRFPGHGIFKDGQNLTTKLEAQNRLHQNLYEVTWNSRFFKYDPLSENSESFLKVNYVSNMKSQYSDCSQLIQAFETFAAFWPLDFLFNFAFGEPLLDP